MKTMAKCFLLSWGLLMPGVWLMAQDASAGRSKVSVHAGPSWYLGKFIGITDYTSSYHNGLRSGMAWSVNYSFTCDGHSPCRIAPGLMYLGSRYKNAHDEGSDKLQMHYIAPQVAFRYVKPAFSISAGAGAGYQCYKDKSTVFGNPRDVSMNKLAFNLSAEGEYLFAADWGVSARLDWISSGSDSYSVKYHGREWQVEAPRSGDGSGAFSRLSLLFGLNFHF